VKKTISVHIVTFNSEAHIKDCLESVIKQSCSVAQIIIIDNASTDRTNEILEEYKGQIIKISNPFNTGFAYAHNQAIKASSCDYILVLNPDIIMQDNYLLNLMEVMQSDLSIGSAAGKLLRSFENVVIDSTGLVMTKARRAFDRCNGKTNNLTGDQPADVFGVSGAAALYSRRMIEDISVDGQFFDESFFAYKEDVDVAWRSRILGWKSMYVPEAVAFHERGWKTGSRQNISIKIRGHSYINRYFMIIKNDHFGYMLLHFPWILFYEIMSLGYVLFKERRLLTSWITMGKQWRSLLKKRAEIQSKRRVPWKQVYRFFR
jgi:GT2 family glycosyltransferase